MSRQFQAPGVFLLESSARNFQVSGVFWLDTTQEVGSNLVARPASDLQAGSWVPSTGSDLFATLDETSASDADYISTTQSSTCIVSLSNTSGTRSGHKIGIRAWSADSSNLRVTLKQSTTTIATWVLNDLPATATTFELSLSDPEIATISDYSALTVTLEAFA